MRQNTELDGILHRLGITSGEKFEPDVFSRRLRIQKAVYLLKAVGYTSASKYVYGSYLRGPYSPDLAREYYAIQPGGIAKARPADIPREYLDPVNYAIRRGNEFLEAAATLHLYASLNPRASRADLFSQVSWVKPDLKRYLEEAWEFLGKHDLLART